MEIKQTIKEKIASIRELLPFLIGVSLIVVGCELHELCFSFGGFLVLTGTIVLASYIFYLLYYYYWR